jgi:hypothetical protein
MSMIALASWLGSLGRLGCLSVIRLPQSFACQRSLVEVRPAIPVCILVGSVGLCVRAGLCGASDPWRSSAAIQILRGLVVVQTSLVPSREHTLQTVRFRVSNTATIKLTPACPKRRRDFYSGNGSPSTLSLTTTTPLPTPVPIFAGSKFGRTSAPRLPGSLTLSRLSATAWRAGLTGRILPPRVKGYASGLRPN